MRIWSKKLINVLPTKQLKGMRYELGDMIKQYPNIKHPLVKFANNYDITYLGAYFLEVCNECLRRKVNMNEQYNINILNIAKGYRIRNTDYYIFEEDNFTYLIICKYNLYEKYLRGIISEEEWRKIVEYGN